MKSCDVSPVAMFLIDIFCICCWFDLVTCGPALVATLSATPMCSGAAMLRMQMQIQVQVQIQIQVQIQLQICVFVLYFSTFGLTFLICIYQPHISWSWTRLERIWRTQRWKWQELVLVAKGHCTAARPLSLPRQPDDVLMLSSEYNIFDIWYLIFDIWVQYIWYLIFDQNLSCNVCLLVFLFKVLTVLCIFTRLRMAQWATWSMTECCLSRFCFD